MTPPLGAATSGSRPNIPLQPGRAPATARASPAASMRGKSTPAPYCPRHAVPIVPPAAIVPPPRVQPRGREWRNAGRPCTAGCQRSPRARYEPDRSPYIVGMREPAEWRKKHRKSPKGGGLATPLRRTRPSPIPAAGTSRRRIGTRAGARSRGIAELERFEAAVHPCRGRDLPLSLLGYTRM